MNERMNDKSMYMSVLSQRGKEALTSQAFKFYAKGSLYADTASIFSTRPSSFPKPHYPPPSARPHPCPRPDPGRPGPGRWGPGRQPTRAPAPCDRPAPGGRAGTAARAGRTRTAAACRLSARTGLRERQGVRPDGAPRQGKVTGEASEQKKSDAKHHT